ncbi:MAG: tyrosine-type recombinase/integrase [Planctomycetia bacterium]|nr:tyrosine-type recombinase/integrase [Planctomycetia bacterium]
MAKEREEGKTPRHLRTPAGEALTDVVRSRAEDCGGTEETVRYYRGALEPFVASMAERPLHRWGPDDTLAWMKAHPKWSPRTIQKFLVQVCTFATWCRARQFDAPGLVGSLRAPRIPRRNRDPLTPDQVAALVAAAAGHDWLEVPVALAAFAGLSLGDCRSLDWTEVDLERRRIVRAHKKSGRPLNVPIAPALAAVPKARRAVAGPVCRAMRASSSAVSKGVRGLYLRAGVPRHKGDGLHALRTAFVSARVAAGVDLATMSDLIGDDPATVARYYTHSASAAREAAVALIASALDDGSTHRRQESV